MFFPAAGNKSGLTYVGDDRDPYQRALVGLRHGDGMNPIEGRRRKKQPPAPPDAEFVRLLQEYADNLRTKLEQLRRLISQQTPMTPEDSRKAAGASRAFSAVG